MTNLKSLFSVGICVSNIKNINNDELKKICIDKCKNTEYSKNDISNEKEIDTIKNIFLKEGQNHLKQILGTNKFINLEIDKIWGNINIDKTISNPHNHRSSLLSSVYYLTNGILVFQNPYLATLAHIHQNDIDSYNQYNSDVWFLKMIPGDLVTFNSQLQHYVVQNNDDNMNSRISIACNMSLKRNI